MKLYDTFTLDGVRRTDDGYLAARAARDQRCSGQG
jgi:hypothetical protein